MAVAGKVAITLSTENGGAWSADVTYDRLVAVKHNNNLYISRKTVANVEPPNDEFWFLALEGFGGDDVQALIDRMNELSDLIQAIIDGTTQVGNAKTLDGHEAEDFLTKTPEDLSVSIFDEVESLPKNSVRFYRLAGAGYTFGDLPDTNYKYSNALVFKYDSTTATIILFGFGNPCNKIAVNRFCRDEWEGWQLCATDADLANYLPLTGGMVKWLYVMGEGDEQFRIYNRKGVVVKTPFYGTIDGDTIFLGGLGFDGYTPIFTSKDDIRSTLLHTGNKPTGTYTGNGDATKRTINIGGIGSICCVKGNYFTAIVHENGAFLMSATATGVIVLTKEQMNFNNGILTIATDSSSVNGNGIVYEYNIP